MKLLIDENLSPRLAAPLNGLYPGSTHVEDCGLISATDEQIWQFARENGFAIVTKDSDFSELSGLRGFPPKVIWLRAGNCTTDRALTTLRESSQGIYTFMKSEMESCLVLSLTSKIPVHGTKE